MAIDTEQKRRSALGRWTLPVADGTIAAGDRAHLCDTYSGLTYAGELVPEAPSDAALAHRYKWPYGNQ